MTAKERAKELIEKFLAEVKTVHPAAFEIKWQKDKAKKCANICVEQIIEAIKPIEEVTGCELQSTLLFWSLVLKEIESL